MKMNPKMKASQLFAVMISITAVSVFAQTNSSTATSTNLPRWITRPLSMVDALNITLQQNSTIKKAQADLEAQQGVVIQTRAIALPTVAATGNATRIDPGLIQTPNFPNSSAFG